MRILGRNDVDSILAGFTVDNYKQIALDALQAFSRGGTVCPPRLSINSPQYTSLHMPSLLGPDSDVVEKVVCVPKAGASGLPASILVLDSQTGEAKALINAFRLTAARTASASLLSSLLIARSDPQWRPQEMLVFGSGEQSLQHICLHLEAFPSLRRVIVVVRSFTDRAERLSELLCIKYPTRRCLLTLNDSYEARGPYHHVDIICCCTPSHEPLFEYNLIKESGKRQHLILIGSYKPIMREIDVETFSNASLVMVDSKQDCLKEAGDLMAAVASGAIEEQDLHELGSLYTNPRTNAALNKHCDDAVLSIYKSVGISVMDSTIALAVLAKAEERSLGTLIEDYL